MSIPTRFSIADQPTPELTDNAIYPEPDWMKRYSTSKSRLRSTRQISSQSGKSATFSITNMVTNAIGTDPQNSTLKSKAGTISQTSTLRSAADSKNRSINPLFEGGSPSNKASTLGNTSVLQFANFKKHFTTGTRKPSKDDNSLTSSQNEIQVDKEPTRRKSSRIKSTGDNSKNTETGNLGSSSLGESFTDETGVSMFKNPLRQSTRSASFAPVVGPMETKYGKHNNRSSFESPPVSPSRGYDESKERTPKQFFTVNNIARMMQFDSGGFNTVYSVNEKKPQPLKGEIFNPSESESSHVEDVSPPISDSRSKSKHSGSVSESIFKAENRSPRPLPKNSNSNNSNSNGTGTGNTATFKAAGSNNLTGGDMDFEAALLLVLLDPTRMHSDDFGTFFKGNSMYDVAIKANEEEIKRLSNELQPDNADLIALKAATADMYKGLGMPVAAEEMLKEVMDSHLRVYGQSSPEYISSANDLGLLLVSMHKFAEAQSLFEEVVSVLFKSQGEVHADTAAALGNLAIALRGQSNFTDAISVQERANMILEATIGAEHANTAYQRGQLGITYIQMGSVQKGRRYIQEALSQLREINNLKEHHPWILSLNAAQILR
eukprot:gene5737-11602_t